jgi:hypothetical protein
VAFKVFEFGKKVPPGDEDHVPPVAEPPTVPDKEAVPPWQMVCILPAFTVGGCTILNEVFDIVVPHSFVTFREIVCEPIAENSTGKGFESVEFGGFPPPKSQEYVGVFVPQFVTVAVGEIVAGPQLFGIEVTLKLGGAFIVSLRFVVTVPHLFDSERVILYIPEFVKTNEG